MSLVTMKRQDRPGWAEIASGLATFGIVLVLMALAVGFFGPNQPVVQGIIGSFAGGVAGMSGFAAVYWMLRRRPAALGLQSSRLRWFASAIGLAAAGYGLSLIIISLHAKLTGFTDTSQAILHAAARGGALPFLLSLFGGAILTPLGEELLFRGVIANGLNRYGSWAGVGLSAVIFGVVHGVGVIMWIAVMVGLLSGALFRKTGSVWPSVLLHAVYNGLHAVGSALA